MMYGRLKKRKKKYCGKVFSETLGDTLCLSACLCSCASSFCLPLGMTEFDCEKSIIVSHTLLKMPTRQFEDQCRPINIYQTSLMTHFVSQQGLNRTQMLMSCDWTFYLDLSLKAAFDKETDQIIHLLIQARVCFHYR